MPERIATINQQIFDNSVDLILVVDRKGNFVRVSPSSQAILGYRPDEMVGRSAIDFLYSEDLENTRQMMRQSRRGRVTRHFDCRYVHKDGHLVLLTWTGIWSEEAQQHFFTGRDITEARALEEITSKLKTIGESLRTWTDTKALLKRADFCWIMELLIIANSFWACWVLLTPPSNFNRYSDTFAMIERLSSNEVVWGLLVGVAAVLTLFGLVGSVGLGYRRALTARCLGLMISGSFWFSMGISTVTGNPDTLFGVPGGVFPGAVAYIIAIRLVMFL